MQNQKKQSISKNAVFSLLAWVLPLGLSFVATPLILNKLGKKDYGVYILILGFVSYSFAFSVGRSITKYVAEYLAVKEYGKINEVISAVILLNLIIGAAAVLLMIFFADWFVVDVLRLEIDLQKETVSGFYLAGFVISATILSQLFSAILQAFHRFDIYSLILVVSNIISTLGNILIVYADLKIEALLIWNLISTLLTTAIYLYFSTKLLPEFKFSIQISRNIFIKVVKYNSAVVLMQFFSNLLVLFERSWITGKFGADALTNYIIPMTLSMMIHMFIGSFIIVIFPVASESHALNKREDILIIYKKATKIVLTLTVFMAMTLIAGRFLILKTWVGANFDEISTEILIFHTLTFAILAVCTVFWQIAEGFGYPHLTAFLSILWLVVTIPLMIVFTEHYTIVSLSVARLIGVLVFIPAIFYAERKIFGGSLWNFWRKNITAVAAAVFFAFIVEYELFTAFPNQPLGLIYSPAAGGLVFGLILYLTKFFDQEEISWFWELKRRLF